MILASLNFPPPTEKTKKANQIVSMIDAAPNFLIGINNWIIPNWIEESRKKKIL